MAFAGRGASPFIGARPKLKIARGPSARGGPGLLGTGGTVQSGAADRTLGQIDGDHRAAAGWQDVPGAGVCPVPQAPLPVRLQEGRTPPLRGIFCIGSVYSLMHRIFEQQKEPLFGRADRILAQQAFPVRTMQEVLSDQGVKGETESGRVEGPRARPAGILSRLSAGVAGAEPGATRRLPSRVISRPSKHARLEFFAPGGLVPPKRKFWQMCEEERLSAYGKARGTAILAPPRASPSSSGRFSQNFASGDTRSPGDACGHAGARPSQTYAAPSQPQPPVPKK